MRILFQVIIPYVNDGGLSRRQRTHNYLLSACRSKIENSFALLRARSRRLKKLPMRNPHLVVDHIMASFVLHNFILLEGNDAEVHSHKFHSLALKLYFTTC